MHFRALFLILIAFAAGLVASAAEGDLAMRRAARQKLSAEEMNRLDDGLKLAVGDQISFRIKEDREEKPRQLRVTDSGEIDLPYIGRHRVVGKSCKEAAMEIKKRLEESYYWCATVTVSIDQYTRSKGKIMVAGFVRTPGEIEMPQGETMTISKAILKVGGFSEWANRSKVRITRQKDSGGKEDITVDVSEILEKGRVEKDIPLLPGDLIYVPQSFIKF